MIFHSMPPSHQTVYQLHPAGTVVPQTGLFPFLWYKFYFFWSTARGILEDGFGDIDSTSRSCISMIETAEEQTSIA